MAKKQKKAGMMKRKAQKSIKKSKQRRSHASRSQSNLDSQQNLSQFLLKVPSLIYEPELEDFEFDQEKVNQYKIEKLSEPEIILALADETWHQSLFERLERIQSRLEANSQKQMIIQGVFQLLGESSVPSFVNPMVVALYLQTCAKISGESIAPSELNKKLNEYETLNKPTIEKIATDMQNASQPSDQAPVDEEENIEDVKPLTVPSELMKAFSETVNEDTFENVQVFVEDYAETPLVEWNLSMVSGFQSWFKKNMNPLEEDVADMQESLKIFFQYLNENKHLSKDQIQTIMPFFDIQS